MALSNAVAFGISFSLFAGVGIFYLFYNHIRYIFLQREIKQLIKSNGNLEESITIYEQTIEQDKKDESELAEMFQNFIIKNASNNEINKTNSSPAIRTQTSQTITPNVTLNETPSSIDSATDEKETILELSNAYPRGLMERFYFFLHDYFGNALERRVNTLRRKNKDLKSKYQELDMKIDDLIVSANQFKIIHRQERSTIEKLREQEQTKKNAEQTTLQPSN